MILSDNETKIDLLNNEAIARTIIETIRSCPARPVTVGVHGDWGAGKSSILEMIEGGLEADNNVLCLKFNGWRYQGFADSKVALIESIASGLVEKRPAAKVAGDRLKGICRRIDWWKVARHAGGLAFTAVCGLPSPDMIQGAINAVEGVLSNPSKLLTDENYQATIDTVRDLANPDIAANNLPEEIGAFRDAFDELLSAASVDQLIVLVDDLDRCLPSTAIETLEAIRLFVFAPRTAFVVAADEAMIEYAVRQHFPALPETTGSQAYARSYLEKLIQVPFRIPALGETETRIYVTLLLLGALLEGETESFDRLVAESRERLRRPWDARPLDAETIRSIVGDMNENVHDALAISDQVGPILATGTRGNPRQIKRFLNMHALRLRIAMERGFADEVKAPILAKLMLAERFMPSVFEEIAGSSMRSNDGACPALAELEAACNKNRERESGDTQDPQIQDATKPHQNGRGEDVEEPQVGADAPVADEPQPAAIDADKGEHSPLAATWIASPDVARWAAIEPSLGDVDLRPYLFVAKDRKSWAGELSAIGPLELIANQLMGGKLAVRSMEKDLAKLGPDEAATIFETVRSRVVGSDEFGERPAGVDGLVVLVRAHPSLQSSFMGFLESLPVERLGAWACSGWEDAIAAPEAKARFQTLLDTWSKRGNAMMKLAAKQILLKVSEKK